MTGGELLLGILDLVAGGLCIASAADEINKKQYFFFGLHAMMTTVFILNLAKLIFT